MRIKILEIALEARKRRILFELCYIFFNPTSFKLFQPIITESNLKNKIKKINFI